MPPWVTRLAVESGLAAMARSGRDARLLCVQRFVRLFAYGATFLVLVDFLARRGVPDGRVGLFMTLTLLGDVVVGLALTSVTDRVGRRRVLAAGAALMALGGSVFCAVGASESGHYWLLVLAGVLGVISPSGNEVGPFRAVEESVLAQLTPKPVRSDVFAWYTMFGTAGTALGSLACGWTVQFLDGRPGWTKSGAYRVVFLAYAVLGLVKLLLTLMLSSDVEAAGADPRSRPDRDGTELGRGLLSDNPLGGPDRDPGPSPRAPLTARLRSLLPPFSARSRSLLCRLVLLFAADSFASGLASPSWLTYFFTTAHALAPAALGALFLATNLLASASGPAAVPLARRLGPLRTMVLTHLPSALLLAAVPLPAPGPRGTPLAAALLALRACVQSMDQAPRQAFLAAAVLPAERTAVLGVVNTAKTLAQAGGLGASGALAARRLWGVMLGGAGALKAAYDLSLLWMFLHLKDRDEEEEEEEEEERAQGG